MQYLELVFLFSFLIFFLFLGKSLCSLSYHSLPFLRCLQDFLTYLWIVAEYFVQVLFCQHKHVGICLRPRRNGKQAVFKFFRSSSDPISEYTLYRESVVW